MGEYLEQKTQKVDHGDTGARHPLAMEEIEPLKDGERVERTENVNGISIYHRAEN